MLNIFRTSLRKRKKNNSPKTRKKIQPYCNLYYF